MAHHPVLHFHNSEGHKKIMIGVKEFMCVGAAAPYDHPHVFLDMGEDSEKVCPYCSTLYVFDAGLGTKDTNPADCLYSEV